MPAIAFSLASAIGPSMPTVGSFIIVIVSSIRYGLIAVAP